MGFPGVNFKKHGIFQGDQETKHYMEFPGVLVLDLKSSEGCNRSLWSFWGKTLFFLEFFLENLKIPVGIFKKVFPQSPICFFFSGKGYLLKTEGVN